ncbi:hypothetical protein JOB18_042188, partial [Solea senegalensis]
VALGHTEDTLLLNPELDFETAIAAFTVRRSPSRLNDHIQLERRTRERQSAAGDLSGDLIRARFSNDAPRRPAGSPFESVCERQNCWRVGSRARQR